jgi:hypothetical protein
MPSEPGEGYRGYRIGMRKTHEACLEEEATADLPGRATAPIKFLYTMDPDIMTPKFFWS